MMLKINLRPYQIPAVPVLLNDRAVPGYDRPKDKPALERSFNDLYAVFLHKLSEFALAAETTASEKARLKALLDELVKTRELLEN